jgi:hypothetical protein
MSSRNISHSEFGNHALVNLGDVVHNHHYENVTNVSVSCKLSVAASIPGLLTAAGKICGLIEPFSVTWNGPNPLQEAFNDVKNVAFALHSLQRYLQRLDIVSPKRAALIQVDELIVTLTDMVLTFSQFENTLEFLVKLGGAMSWVRYPKQIEEHMAKIQRHKASLTMMLNIIQWYSPFDTGLCQSLMMSPVNRILKHLRTRCHFRGRWRSF